MPNEDLIKRAREYLDEKVLDLADVPRFIKLLVELNDETQTLRARITVLETITACLYGDHL